MFLTAMLRCLHIRCRLSSAAEGYLQHDTLKIVIGATISLNVSTAGGYIYRLDLSASLTASKTLLHQNHGKPQRTTTTQDLQALSHRYELA